MARHAPGEIRAGRRSREVVLEVDGEICSRHRGWRYPLGERRNVLRPSSRDRRGVEEDRMTWRSEPPFRADHVGSLLRPPELLQARAEHAAGSHRRARVARASRTTPSARPCACRRQSACSRRPTASSGAAPGTWTSSTSSAGSRSWTRTSWSSSGTAAARSASRRRRCASTSRCGSTTRSSPTTSRSCGTPCRPRCRS